MPLSCVLGSPCFEATVYAGGMLLLTSGVGLLIATTNRRQFSFQVWCTLVVVAVILIVIGLIIAILSCRIPTYRSITHEFTVRVERSSTSSMEDMLDDVESAGCRYSSVVELHDVMSAHRSAEVVRNCMMFQDQLQPRLFRSGSLYQETYI